jgi:CO/xanthine dehydrogenase FAD-binding subunit
MAVSWEYPETIDELVECLKKDTKPVGGGTGLLRNVPKSGVLADLSRLGLGYVRSDGGIATIGGTASFALTASVLEDAFPGNIISAALDDAASPALRNTITMGGSIALFPPWGRVVGPLVALDATLRLVGESEGEYAVAEYFARKELWKRTAIVEIKADMSGNWESHWYRFSPVRFNYPLFTVVVLVEPDREVIADSRVVVTGNRGRFKRLTEVEDAARGSRRSEVEVLANGLGTAFPDRQGFTGDYLAHLAAVEITRALRGSTGGNK